MIKLKCNNCGATYQVQPSVSGVAYKCQHCQSLLKPENKTPLDDASTLHHCILGGHGYMKVTSGKDVIIGRGDDCQIIVDDGKVSRQHAKLRCNGNSCVLSDLNSKNGLYLGNVRIQTSELKDGDIFFVGGHSFTYRALNNPEDTSNLVSDYRSNARCRETVEMTTTMASIPAGDFRGALSMMSILDICQLLSLNKRSGMLQVAGVQGRKGTLGFAEGEIIYAECDRFTGNKSIYEMLAIETGNFCFRANAALNKAPNVIEKTSQILLDAASHLGEAI
ncbi:MAG: FHA domain-containing protein [Planctomycetes bacterium]|nr:FHA domain-containing protein [Planctomycetota bacterium]